MWEITAPLRSLIRLNVEWSWDPTVQGESFEAIKRTLQNAPVLRYFDNRKPVVVQWDASQSGLGCTILQDRFPPAYGSRSLSVTEQAYAQIKKECLAIVFEMEKFHTYVYGRSITVETDHKPLVSIFSKLINNAPKRLQRMMLRLQNYQFNLVFKPGSQVVVADALSRAYPKSSAKSASQYFDEELACISDISGFQKEIEVGESLNFLVASESLKRALKESSSYDPIISDLRPILQNGWPDRADQLAEHLRPFFSFRDELIIEDNLLFKGSRLYVPAESRADVLQRVHSSHLGLQGCLRRARESIFWPNMTADITKMATNCAVCARVQNEQAKELIMAHEIPDRPWQRIACDLFQYQSIDYLITVDYFSNFFEVDRLITDKRAPEIIRHLKAHCARYGLPDIVITDNGPPFNSAEFEAFASKYEFQHRTSSPYWSQSNGKAENSIRTLKTILKKASEAKIDPYLALLDFRNTPSEMFDTSPAQRLLGRRVRTTCPIDSRLLDVPKAKTTKHSLQKAKQKQAKYYNRGARNKPVIPINQTVRAKIDDKRGWVKAKVIEQLPYRSYNIETDTGAQYRRNRKHLRFSDETTIIPSDTSPEENVDHSFDSRDNSVSNPDQDSVKQQHPISAQNKTTTRSGREIRQPVRFSDYVTR